MTKCAGDYGNHNDENCGTWHEQFDQNPHMMYKLPEPSYLRPEDWDDLDEEIRQAINLFYDTLNPLYEKAKELRWDMILQLNHLDHIIDDYNRSITAEDLRSMLANNDYLKQRGIEIGYTKQGTDAGSITDADLESYIENYHGNISYESRISGEM